MSDKIIGYKKLRNGYIAKLEIIGRNNQGRESVKPEHAQWAKYRCKSARVLDIYKRGKHVKSGTSECDASFKYIVGTIASVPNYKNSTKVCAAGIHYYLDEALAKQHNRKSLTYTGLVRKYTDNGVLQCEYNLVKGKKNGLVKTWDYGILVSTYEYLHDVAHGEFKKWDHNGVLSVSGTYCNGIMVGDYNSWNCYEHVYKKYNDKGVLIMSVRSNIIYGTCETTTYAYSPNTYKGTIVVAEDGTKKYI